MRIESFFGAGKLTTWQRLTRADAGTFRGECREHERKATNGSIMPSPTLPWLALGEGAAPPYVWVFVCLRWCSLAETHVRSANTQLNLTWPGDGETRECALRKERLLTRGRFCHRQVLQSIRHRSMNRNNPVLWCKATE